MGGLSGHAKIGEETVQKWCNFRLPIPPASGCGATSADCGLRIFGARLSRLKSAFRADGATLVRHYLHAPQNCYEAKVVAYDF